MGYILKTDEPHHRMPVCDNKIVPLSSHNIETDGLYSEDR
jgi:hypothetical protein